MKAIPVFFFASICVAIMAIVVIATPTPREPVTQPQDFMRQKSIHSQMALDALMKEQFDIVVLAGENMKKMTKDKRWNRLETDDYFRFSETFQMQAQTMIDAARDKSADRAMEGYLRCLQTCYNCHRYVRAEKHL